MGEPKECDLNKFLAQISLTKDRVKSYLSSLETFQVDQGNMTFAPTVETSKFGKMEIPMYMAMEHALPPNDFIIVNLNNPLLMPLKSSSRLLEHTGMAWGYIPPTCVEYQTLLNNINSRKQTTAIALFGDNASALALSAHLYATGNERLQTYTHHWAVPFGGYSSVDWAKAGFIDVGGDGKSLVLCPNCDKGLNLDSYQGRVQPNPWDAHVTLAPMCPYLLNTKPEGTRITHIAPESVIHYAWSKDIQRVVENLNRNQQKLMMRRIKDQDLQNQITKAEEQLSQRGKDLIPNLRVELEQFKQRKNADQSSDFSFSWNTTFDESTGFVPIGTPSRPSSVASNASQPKMRKNAVRPKRTSTPKGYPTEMDLRRDTERRLRMSREPEDELLKDMYGNVVNSSLQIYQKPPGYKVSQDPQQAQPNAFQKELSASLEKRMAEVAEDRTSLPFSGYPKPLVEPPVRDTGGVGLVEAVGLPKAKDTIETFNARMASHLNVAINHLTPQALKPELPK